MNKLLRMLLLVVVLCMMLLPLSSAYVRAYGDEVETYGVEQEASETARDDAQFLRIEVTRKEDDVIIKADDTKRSAAKDGATKGQGYINTSMAEYNATDLSGYTTEELVVFILNNHRSMSSALYDHALDPYTSAKRYYHGLEELESHEDALDVLYRALTVLEEAEPTTDRERIVYDMRVDFIHMLLNSEFYQGKISGENSLAYGETVQSELSTNVSRSLIGAYGFLYDYAGTVYSRGNEVVSVYSATSDHADEQKEQIRDRLCEAHPNAIYRSEATSKYNGISYAWYSASTSNVYCIFDLSPYLRDAHTSWVEVESWSECQVNDIIVYYNADGEPIHAAIVTANDNGDVVATSKWNDECLFTHRVADVPDSMYSDPSTGYFVAEVYRVSRHNYTVTSYNSAGHTFTCSVCDDAYTVAHTVVNGGCRFCGYVGNGSVTPFE